MAITLNGSTNAITPKTAVQPAGSILQVVSTSKTDTFSSTSSTFTDVTGMSVAITPSSANSKILVLLQYNVAASGDYAQARLERTVSSTETVINLGDADGNRIRGLSYTYHASDGYNWYILNQQGVHYLDSPSTTSEVTYKLQVAMHNNSSNVYVNRSSADANSDGTVRGTSNITAMEVAA
tara:strand:- start:189 stop:731 length:543 start_codon:yes stop_codon:yes gene_type:complete